MDSRGGTYNKESKEPPMKGFGKSLCYILLFAFAFDIFNNCTSLYSVVTSATVYFLTSLTGVSSSTLILFCLTGKGIFQPASSLSSTKKLVFGIFIVVVIATSWVGSTQTAQSTYDGKFRAPFFLVWFGTSWMLLVFPVTVPLYFIINKKTVNQQTINELLSHSKEIVFPSTFSLVSILTSTVLFTLIWIPTNYMYARALISIAATDVTAIFSTAPAFVFIFSMIILREPPLLLRFFAVILSISGIVLFAYVDGFGTANTWSIALSIGSAIGAALYKTLLKRRVKEASLFQMAFFLSTIGLFTLLVFWPLVVLLHFTHAEILVDVPWSYLCGSSILGVLFNFAINFGIAYTFPLFISLGTIMGIPLNALLDAVIRHVDLANWKITAMDLVIGGFLLMLVPPSVSLWIEGKLCCKRSEVLVRPDWLLRCCVVMMTQIASATNQ